jgi:hypothetical protein
MRRVVSYGFYAAVMVGLIQGTRSPFNGELYGFSILFLRALLIFYDDFVWKLRRPQLAASLGIS